MWVLVGLPDLPVPEALEPSYLWKGGAAHRVDGATVGAKVNCAGARRGTRAGHPCDSHPLPSGST